MFGSSNSDREAPRTPPGYRAYAIGDIHGRLDLLDRLLGAIDKDIAEHPSRKILLVFLGDLIDRGPESRGVVERLRTLSIPRARLVFLAGNHEEVLLRLLAGERGIMASWLKFGGVECLASYGVDATKLPLESESQSLARIREAIPAEHREFLTSFADTLRFGGYLFVHAGIRPDVDLGLQRQSDLRWIRHPFLSDERDHGFVVVHGHTISSQVDERPNRIGIDTGAYRSGVLTAVVLDGVDRSYLSTGYVENGAKSLLDDLA